MVQEYSLYTREDKIHGTADGDDTQEGGHDLDSSPVQKPVEQVGEIKHEPRDHQGDDHGQYREEPAVATVNTEKLARGLKMTRKSTVSFSRLPSLIYNHPRGFSLNFFSKSRIF
jgi:hypothetical protein